MKNAFLFFIAMGAAIVFIFQSCSDKASFSAAPSRQELAFDHNGVGDYGTGGGGYSCVQGQRLAIYIDPEKSGQVVESNYLGSVVSYSGQDDAKANYNYYSDSAHPIVGPTPLGFESNVFFYEDMSGLNLNLFANIDAGGSTDNIWDVDIKVEGNDLDDRVLLSDDNSELKEVSPSYYQGRFHYWSNTDGGVIGPMKKDVGIKVLFQFQETGDIHSARFYSANGFSFKLESSSLNISSFIIVNEGYEECTAK
ncbi:MAG: hypothetical protein KDD33_02750 [Bdellovibrionales bacterium]|nr:hypothetical protein [Bdellovibrionales bacterium]